MVLVHSEVQVTVAEAAAVVLVRPEVLVTEAEAAAVVLVRPEVQATVPGHQPRSEA